MRHRVRAGLALAVLGTALLASVWRLGVHDAADVATGGDRPQPSSAKLVAQGAYLARAGNCGLCHTQRGGSAYAGGRAMETPFGTVFSSNLTPDPATGLGSWTSGHFWRALHHGRSRDGRLLYPAFPYTSMTQVTRADSDALFAYLQSLAPVAQTNTAHRLRWPYNTQAALALWRALYFKPGSFEPVAGQSAPWNRGAYLVRGLGHCNACHTARNALGAPDTRADLAGGPIPMQNWYAPSLLSPSEAGVAEWDEKQVVALLQTGLAPRGAVTGPMAEVVLHSTQFLSGADLVAMAVFLKSLPSVAPAAGRGAAAAAPSGGSPQGAKLYEKHCAQCHGDQGAGVPGAYPALAGNRAVLMGNASNLVQIVLHGGFAPATAGNPRPYGMPPYMVLLGDSEIAQVLTHIRSAWGNRAGEVTELDVTRNRAMATR